MNQILTSCFMTARLVRQSRRSVTGGLNLGEGWDGRRKGTNTSPCRPPRGHGDWGERAHQRRICNWVSTAARKAKEMTCRTNGKRRCTASHRYIQISTFHIESGTITPPHSSLRARTKKPLPRLFLPFIQPSPRVPLRLRLSQPVQLLPQFLILLVEPISAYFGIVRSSDIVGCIGQLRLVPGGGRRGSRVFFQGYRLSKSPGRVRFRPCTYLWSTVHETMEASAGMTCRIISG